VPGDHVPSAHAWRSPSPARSSIVRLIAETVCPWARRLALARWPDIVGRPNCPVHQLDRTLASDLLRSRDHRGGLPSSDRAKQHRSTLDRWQAHGIDFPLRSYLLGLLPCQIVSPSSHTGVVSRHYNPCTATVLVFSLASVLVQREA
jgi:hypothetical protein